MKFTVHELTRADIPNLLLLRHQLFQETPWLKYEPNEESYSQEIESRICRNFLTSQNSMISVARADDDFVGFVLAQGGISSKTKHSVCIAIGVLDSYKGKGVGTSLMDHLHSWTEITNIHRMELVVANPNKTAQKFFKKYGFVEEGIKHHAILYQGAYIDQTYMFKLL